MQLTPEIVAKANRLVVDSGPTPRFWADDGG